MFTTKTKLKIQDGKMNASILHTELFGGWSGVFVCGMLGVFLFVFVCLGFGLFLGWLYFNQNRTIAKMYAILG